VLLVSKSKLHTVVVAATAAAAAAEKKDSGSSSSCITLTFLQFIMVAHDTFDFYDGIEQRNCSQV
jgi:hypothetical protein